MSSALSIFEQSRLEAAGWVQDGPLLRPAAEALDPLVRSQREAYRAGGGTAQRQRSADPRQAGHYDMALYRDEIAALLAGAGPDTVVADLGCGNGRILEVVLGHPVGHVVALDFNDHDLRDIWASLGDADRRRVTLLCASLTSPPPTAGVADVVLAVEATPGLPDRGAFFAAAAQWLRPGGRLMLVEPSRTGYFVHALLNRNWDLIRQLTTGRYEQAYGDGSMCMHFADDASLPDLAREHGLALERERSVPAEMAVLLHALKDADALEATMDVVAAVAADLPLRIPRSHLQIYRKTA